MAFFSHNLIHTLTYARPSSTVDANGDPSSIAAQVTGVPCKAKYERNIVRDANGNEVVTEHVIATEYDAQPGDRIWVPFWGDDITKPGDARHPIAIRKTEALRGNATLVRIFL